MSSLVTYLNTTHEEDARAQLLRCCGSTAWAKAMLQRRPFADEPALFKAAEEIWWQLGPADWREAFAHHPRIGERQLAQRFAATRSWSEQEQAGTARAEQAVLTALKAGNSIYEERFGFVFLICATGQSAEAMRSALFTRLENDPETELRIAAGEQAKITRLRLEKLTR